MSHIFLSYSRRDVWIMRLIKSALKSEGIAIWVDEKLEPGTSDWQEEIRSAIKQAGCMVVILSPDATESDWVKKEILEAQLQQLKIFPLLARGENKDIIPDELEKVQWIDIRNNYEVGLQQLITTVKNQPGITIVNYPPPEIPDSEHIRWDRIGSVVWYTSDCQSLIDKIMLTNEISHDDMKRFLEQCYHHAKRLNYSAGMSEVESLLEIIKRSEDHNSERDDDPHFNHNFLSHYVKGLTGILSFFAKQAEKVDADYDPGPMWKRPFS